MPKSKVKNKKKQAESNAAWRITTLFIVLGAVTFGTLWWARTNSESEAAGKIREILGIVLLDTATPEPVAEQEPIPMPMPVDPVIQPEPEPEPEPVIAIVEPEPSEPEALSWSDFRNQSSMWPSSLIITVDKEAQLNYRGENYGEVSFNSGQPINNLLGFSKDGFVLARINAIVMEVHLSATNFESWFDDTHGELYEMNIPAKVVIKPATDFEEELLVKLRIWCMKSYSTPLIEIDEDKLIMRLRTTDRDTTEGDYALEALSVAQAYLRIQAALGGSDTYASCEIRDTSTGEIVGSKGIFIPRL